ncbi:uncharacterized protein LOC123309538 [Coccinella septempunctata]|uniref:uncharacterized protein LOC123309538 n=1 Tax=Coccinella septempunctata TaxID=41139 RepID=UPI001D090B1C|nr:uncharacterized protein LOC123309538 [Coccinella septempunctata]
MENQSNVVVLTLPQVIDVALTGPELGLVSYRLLNNILQVMCQQLNLEEVKMQYQGMQAIQIDKIWNPDMKSKLPQVTPVKRTKLVSADENEQEKIVVIPDGPSERFPAMTLAISTSQLQTMERNIRSLQKEVSDLRALPSNNELFKAVKAKAGEPTPILDMYQILTVTKRMEATEQAVIKISSFVEDLAKYVQSEAFEGLGDDFETMVDRPQRRGSSLFTDKKTSKMRVGSGVAAEASMHDATKTASTAKVPKNLDIGALSTSATQMKTDHPVVVIHEDIGEEGFTEKRIKDRTDKDNQVDSAQSSAAASQVISLPESKLTNISVSGLSPAQILSLIQEDLMNLRTTVDALQKRMSTGGSTRREVIGGVPVVPSIQTPGEGESKPGDNRLSQVELKLNQCIGQLNKMDSIFSSSYSALTHRMADMESSLKVLSNKVLQDVGTADVEEQMTQNIFTINGKVLALESVVTKMSDAVNVLIEENSSKKTNIMNLAEDVDCLKADKVGRDEFTEALSEKVDICMINRKVSHDQFNATCDDLSKGIEEALEKLMEQEELWHIALKEIQGEISEKLGRDDLSPLKEFITDKLKSLQNKVKTLAKMKHDQEAAATKSKFLKGVQCISCDQDVIMRKKVDESINYPGAPILAPHKNIAPYLAYELDQLRRQQRQMDYGRNLHHFESATKDGKGVVNRYCGGSHTITTPQQRVTRLGNFAEQWGPKSLQVERETFQCQSSRSERKNSLTITKSGDSINAKNNIKFDMAEKDEGVKVPSRSNSESKIKS